MKKYMPTRKCLPKKNVFAPIPYPVKMCCFMCYIYVNKSFCEALRHISALI